MADTLTDSRREDIWVALSNVFIDDPVDYSRIEDVAPAKLEKIFFDEVMLYCGPQMLSVTPPTFEGFDRSEMIASIWKKLKTDRNSTFARLSKMVSKIFLRWFFRNEWKVIASELAKRRPYQAED